MEYRVTGEDAGRSVRDLLRHALQLSEGAIRRAKWDGRILVNGAPATVRTLCSPGDLLCFVPAGGDPVYTPAPLAMDLSVPWRSGELLIIDKPAPLASQSGRGHPNDSLENAVYAWLGQPEDFVYRPVNRLDRGTSGLMAVALTAEEQARMQRLLHTEAFRRSYLAVTDGVPPLERGVIDRPIAKADGATIRRECRPDGRPSVTRYEVLRVRGGRALLRLTLETGRTHQIRVHLASLGCPVFGDFLYGTESDELPGRFALHSAEIVFPTREGETVRLTSPLPAALERLLEGV